MMSLLGRGVAALLMAVAAPALAAPGGAAAPAAKPAVVKFDPPMGAPLRYRLTREVHVTRDGKDRLRDRITSTEELQYLERNADGFLLRWISSDAKVEAAAPMQKIIEATVAAAIDKPMLIQTDPAGAPLAIVNLPDVRRMLVESFGKLSTGFAAATQDAPPEAAAMMRQMVAGMIETYSGLDEASLTQLLLEHPTMFLSYAGSAAVPGRPVPFENRVPVPLAGVEVAMTGQVELRRQGPDGTTFVASSATDPAGVRQAIAAFLTKASAEVPAEQRAMIAEAAKRMEAIAITDELTLTLDPAGIPVRAAYRKRAAAGGQGQLETLALERLP